MYSDVFCKVYNEFGWNYYPEIFGEQLLEWLRRKDIKPRNSMDLACGTGILCEILQKSGIRASGMDFSSGMIEIARSGNPDIPYEMADMVTFRPEEQFDLVTCTGDALNHIADIQDVERIFRNVYAYTSKGGHFVFDILNEHEVSTSEPFEMDFSDTVRVWFQMTRPGEKQVSLKIRYEKGKLSFEEIIRETIHDPVVICDLLRKCGFEVVKCADRLLDDGGPYLMFRENRKTYQCYPSYQTIGQAVGMSRNTVKKYVDGLVEKQLIYTEPTTVLTKDGKVRNGNLLYTIRPLDSAREYYVARQVKAFEQQSIEMEQKRREGSPV